jgi:hypothetical protein
MWRETIVNIHHDYRGAIQYGGNKQILLHFHRYVLFPLGMKMERKRTELSSAIFVFIFLCGSRNEYRNTGNKYENGYFQKQT